jgi:hypothetical protein
MRAVDLAGGGPDEARIMENRFSLTAYRYFPAAARRRRPLSK